MGSFHKGGVVLQARVGPKAQRKDNTLIEKKFFA
jgi:hypothetical protein